MLQDGDRKLVERFKRLLIEHGMPLYKTFVFGLQARGDAEPDSDLDVLVLLEYSDATLRKTIRHCAWEVGFDAGILIQTVVMTREEAGHRPEQSSLLMLGVKKEGIPV
jgi:predicted nucleotidyltransferase